MIRFLFYAFPAMMEMVICTAFFVCTLRFAESGASAFKTSAIVAMWSAVYMLGSHLLGFSVNAKNSIFFIITASIGTVLISLGAIFITGLEMQFVLIGLLAVFSAFFFIAFQVFMKFFEKREAHGLTISTSLYTFSWSIGTASGPFISGYLWHRFGWQSCYVVNTLIGVLMTGTIFYLKSYFERNNELVQEKTGTAGNHDAQDKVNVYEKMPSFAWLGWLGGGVCCFSVALLRGVFPSTAVNLGLCETEQGNIFAVMGYVQAIAGLMLLRSRLWMYRIVPVALFAAAAMTGLLIFAFSRNYYLFLFASIMFGIYISTFLFYMVFHSLVHPEKSSRYISINETVIGFTGIIGPLLGGLIADHINHPAVYLTCCTLILGVLFVQGYAHTRKGLANEKCSSVGKIR